MLKVLYQKQFLKELSKIPSKRRKEIEEFVFEELPLHNSFFEIGKFEKMTGYQNFYKARFGDYRVGVYLINDVLELRRVLHRKEIYRYFP